MHLSILIPVYNSQATIKGLIEEIQFFFLAREASFEILLVDDGSAPACTEVLEELSRRPHVRVVFLRENVGQQNALYAGVLEARGEWVFTLDDDGKHSLGMYEVMKGTGSDIVFAAEQFEKRELFRSLGARLRNRFFRRRFGGDGKVSALRLFKRELLTPSPHRFVYLSAQLLLSGSPYVSVPMVKEKERRRSGYTLLARMQLYLRLVFYYSRRIPQSVRPRGHAFTIERRLPE